MERNYFFYYEIKPDGQLVVSVTSDSDDRTTNFVSELEERLLLKLNQPVPFDHSGDDPLVNINAAYKMEISAGVKPTAISQIEASAKLEKIGFKKRPKNL